MSHYHGCPREKERQGKCFVNESCYLHFEGFSVRKTGKSDRDCVAPLLCPVHGRVSMEHFFP